MLTTRAFGPSKLDYLTQSHLNQ